MSKVAVLLLIICLVAVACAPAPKPPSAPSIPRENRPPQAVAIVGPMELKPSAEGSLICAATDPDADILTYDWSAEQGVISGSGKQVTWTTPAETGEFSVTCKVTDGKGGEAEASRKFKVTDNPYGNEQPDKTIYLKLTIPSGETVQVNRQLRSYTTGEIECVVANQDPARLTFKWSAPAGKLYATDLDGGKATRVGWVAPGSGGTYTVAVTVTDLGGNQAQGQVNFEVLCCKDPAPVSSDNQ